MIYHCEVEVKHNPYYGDSDTLEQSFLIDAPDAVVAEDIIYKFYEKQSSEGESFIVLNVTTAINLNSADF
jgi:hypothetical protein